MFNKFWGLVVVVFYPVRYSFSSPAFGSGVMLPVCCSGFLVDPPCLYGLLVNTRIYSSDMTGLDKNVGRVLIPCTGPFVDPLIPVVDYRWSFTGFIIVSVDRVYAWVVDAVLVP